MVMESDPISKEYDITVIIFSITAIEGTAGAYSRHFALDLRPFAFSVIRVHPHFILTKARGYVELPMANKIVVHYIDGKIERGYTSDFQPGRDVFHLVVKNGDAETSLPITISDLKAVFFVKELHGRGRASSQEKKDFADLKDEKIVGKKVKVEFNDGEIICGLTLGYSPKRKGFFFTPIEEESNNERIFAVLSFVKKITFYE